MSLQALKSIPSLPSATSRLPGELGADHAVVHVIQLSGHCAAGTQEGVRTGARARVQVQGGRSEDIFGLRSDSRGKRE